MLSSQRRQGASHYINTMHKYTCVHRPECRDSGIHGTPSRASSLCFFDIWL